VTTASLQILSAVIRLHEYGGYGDPWEWIAFVAGDIRRPGLATIVGAQTAPPLGALPAIAQPLWTPPGFTHVTWGRKKDGKDRWPEFEIERWLR
jgi:hypothetical protein